MTKQSLQKIGSGIQRQYEIMEVLERELARLRSQSTGAATKQIEELETLVKLLAKTTHDTGEEIIKNVA